MSAKHPPYVALVDEDFAITRMLRFLIERRLRVSTREFNRSVEALHLLPTDIANILLVICDLRMPEVDGLQVCRRLHESDPECPVILLTAYVSKEMEAEARRIGVHRVVQKPFVPDVFVEEIRHLVGERRRRWKAAERR